MLGPWAEQAWDLVLDLGLGGRNSYERWSRFFQCPTEPTRHLNPAQFYEIRQALRGGLGALVDQHGLDWWDLISFKFHQELEEIARLQSLTAQLDHAAEISITRAGFQAAVLSLLTNRKPHCFSSRSGGGKKIRHYAQVVSKFPQDELLQILGDKYDSGYRLRRVFTKHPKRLPRPIVLLPSAYVNVSRTEFQYAEMLPDTDFLLVATRESALKAAAPQNVQVAKLASYACKDENQSESESLLARWKQLAPELMRFELLSVLIRSGLLDSVPAFLRNGLRIRDAWLQVFRRQPVRAVLCADDGNHVTRMPLMIASKMGVPALSCHHGALDGRYRMRPPHDWPFLAKSQMEREYLVHECQVAPEIIGIGAPRSLPGPRAETACEKRSIVFFSESYEVMGGRCREFYREILPPLAELAASAKRKLILKLHPMENLRERKLMANSVLSESTRGVLEVVGGPLTDELLNQTWFAVTLASTIAVDCTLSGIPVFVCDWLDWTRYGYQQHFVKFGAGTALESPDRIREIPAMLQRSQWKSTARLWQTISPDRLRTMLGGALSMAVAG